MKRLTMMPRPNYVDKLKGLGFEFSDKYWLENACYQFEPEEINEISLATEKCYEMFVAGVQHVIDNDLWDELHIPRAMVPTIIESWDSDELSLYGRFDFALVGGVPKLLEFNADTPTSLLEASIIQWHWKEDVIPSMGQFNDIHEKLVESWKYIHEKYNSKLYHFACLTENLEDNTTTAYLTSTANEAGLDTALIDMESIALIGDKFYNMEHHHLDVLFKLYPWEWMFNEEFAEYIPGCETTFIEPLWKSVMSNKYMLVILSKLFPDSPYVLKADTNPLEGGSFCKKPIFSREGANVQLIKNGEVLEETAGEYGEEGFIYQELVEIPSFDGKHPVLGSWVVGGEPAGMGIRETDSRITSNMANFVPHVY